MNITVPATPAMPQVINANNSPRCMRERYGRTSNGASIMPTNTCTAAPRANGPLMPSAPTQQTCANSPVTNCSTPQWNSNDAKALMVNTSGSAWNASTKLAPGCDSANGNGGPAR